MTVNLGVIEGLFGKPWSWADRTTVLRTLAPAGYRFYHYGPKADPFLRRPMSIHRIGAPDEAEPTKLAILYGVFGSGMSRGT